MSVDGLVTVAVYAPLNCNKLFVKKVLTQISGLSMNNLCNTCVIIYQDGVRGRPFNMSGRVRLVLRHSPV